MWMLKKRPLSSVAGLPHLLGLELANMGNRVYLVEKEPSIGGVMAQLDKTFPTNDCSACILTPVMVDAGTHPNITLLTYSEIDSVEGYIGNFDVKIRRKQAYVDWEKCTAAEIAPQPAPSERPMNTTRAWTTAPPPISTFPRLCQKGGH